MKLIVLDVDETLIHSSDKKTIHSVKLDDGDLYLNPRPYLNRFLKYLFKNYYVIIWSAGEKKYIDFFVKTFITSLGYKPLLVLTRNNCDTIIVEDNEVDYIKPLSIIWRKYKSFNSTNTIIVDDKKSTAIFNPTNHISIKKYENQENDKELYKLMIFLYENERYNNVKSYCSKFK